MGIADEVEVDWRSEWLSPTRDGVRSHAWMMVWLRQSLNGSVDFDHD